MVFEEEINLKGNIAPTATNAAKQVALLEKALKGVEAQAVKAAALGDIGKMQKLQVQYANLTGSVGLLKSEFGHMVTAEDAAAKKAKETAGGLSALGVATGEVLAKMAEGLFGVAESIAHYGFEQEEALNATLATFAAFTGGPAAAKGLLDTIDAMRTKLGMTREQLVPMANDLLAMGVSAGDVKGKLETLATVKAIGIEGGPEEFLAIQKKLSAQLPVTKRELAGLYKTGVNVSDIAKAMGIGVKELEVGLQKGTVSSKAFSVALDKAINERGADALAVQADNLGNQWNILKEKVVAKVFPYIKVALLTVLVTALRLYVSIVQNWPKIKPILMGVGAAIAAVGTAFLVSMIPAAWSAVVAFGALAIGVIAATWPILAIAVAVGLVVYAFAKWGNIFKIAGDWLGDLAFKAVQFGASFVSGLVNGIESAATRAVDAVKGLGKKILGGIKGALGIASPSRIGLEIGRNLGHSIGAGLGQSSPTVDVNARAFATGTASAADPVQHAGAAGGGRGGGRMVHFTFQDGAIRISGAGSSGEALSMTQEAVMLMFERAAAQQGLGEPT